MTSLSKNMKSHEQETKRTQRKRTRAQVISPTLSRPTNASYFPSTENLSFLSPLVFIHGQKIHKVEETLQVRHLLCLTNGLLFTPTRATPKKVKENLSKDTRTPHPIAQQFSSFHANNVHANTLAHGKLTLLF